MRSTKSCSLKFCFDIGVGPFCDASSDQLKVNQIVCLYSPFYIGNWWLPAVNPPSMTKTAPIAKLASSDARNSAAFAMSMGFPIHPNGYHGVISSKIRGFRSIIGSQTSVCTVPGQIQLIRILSLPCATAIEQVNAITLSLR